MAINKNTKAGKKIFRALVSLLNTEPFFATLALKMDHIENPNVQTACTNGKVIYYNPAFIEPLTHDEVVFLIAHECMHPALLHHTRRQGRKPGKWNRAADYAINEILTKKGMKMIAGGLLNSAYYGMNAEKIYDLLPDEPDDDGNGDPGGCGGVMDAPAKSKSEIDQIEAECKQSLASAAQAAKKRGKVPGDLQRVIDEILEPKVDWQEALARFICERSRNDYTFKKPNPRYLGSGFYLPYLENEEIGEIVLMVDTSGSIGVEELNQFAAEMQEIVNTFGKGFTVLWIDADVQGEQYIEPDSLVNLQPQGGGGTDFAPGFNYLKEQDRVPMCVVYLTDGWCSDFAEEPEYPVLWALTGDNQYFKDRVPYGETIIME